jgi:hypothetical protein
MGHSVMFKLQRHSFESDGKMIMNGEKLKIDKEAVLAYFMLLSQHSSEGNQENHEKSVRIASNPAEIQTGNLLNASQKW